MTDSDQEKRWAGWMLAAQEGNQELYQKLLTELAQYLEKWMLRSIHQMENSQDIVQEILLCVHRAKHTYLPNRPFKPWLNAIARNKLIDYIRKHQRNREYLTWEESPFDPVDDTFRESLNQGLSDRLSAALQTLPEKQRQIIELLKLEDQSVREVAEKLEMNESAVKVAAHRAYKRLRKKLITGEEL